MSNLPTAQNDKHRNGYPTVGNSAAEHGEIEPKGSPTADRYRAETAHHGPAGDGVEPDDAPKPRNRHRQE
jgi:hypothetical protein